MRSSAQRLELVTGERRHQMLGAIGGRGDEGEVDFGFEASGELVLGPLRRFTQALQSHAIGT